MKTKHAPTLSHGSIPDPPSQLEAQVRKLEGQLAQARTSQAQYEERLMARKVGAGAEDVWRVV
jgi:hypothetical protein